MKPNTSGNPAAQAGWAINDYLPLIGDPSRSWLYALPVEKQPRSIKMGKRRIITESPVDYLKRISGAT